MSKDQPNNGTKVTSFDVARAAGVSQSTVSRALRGDPKIGRDTVKRVLAVAKQLDYVPSERARDLSTRTTRRIAMVVDLDNPLWSLLVSHLYDELDEHGYRLTLAAGHGDPSALEHHLLGGGVDGVIISTATLDSPLPAALRRRGIPAVLLHRFTNSPDADACVADNRAGGAAAGRMLLEAGHRSIGALFGPDQISTGQERTAGFREVLGDAGIELRDVHVRTGAFDLRGGQAMAAEILARPDRPSALFCFNDIVALGAMNAAAEAGLKVPDDLALVGFDDLPEAAWPIVQLSTVHVPFADMLTSAVSMLMERIGGHEGDGRRIIHPVRAVPRLTHG